MAGSKKKEKGGKSFFSARRAERRRKKKVQAYLHGDVKIPPSAHGRLSIQIGLICLALIVIVIAIAYLTHGEAGAFIGAIGLIAVFLSCLGIFQGLVGLGEKKRDFAPCRRGIIFNLVLLMVLVLMFFSGLRS